MSERSKHVMVDVWRKNENFQAFMRQVHCDIYVGVKNGAPIDECKKALNELADTIRDSVDWELKELKRKG